MSRLLIGGALAGGMIAGVVLAVAVTWIPARGVAPVVAPAVLGGGPAADPPGSHGAPELPDTLPVPTGYYRDDTGGAPQLFGRPVDRPTATPGARAGRATFP